MGAAEGWFVHGACAGDDGVLCCKCGRGNGRMSCTEDASVYLDRVLAEVFVQHGVDGGVSAGD